MNPLRQAIGASLLLATSVGHSAVCNPAVDSASLPETGFVRTLYDVDFEAPTHTAGSWPVEGFGPAEVGLYHDYLMAIPEAHKGLPEVVVQPLLDSQSAELNARPINTDKLDYDDVMFQLGRAANYYTAEFDLVIDENINLTRTLITASDMAGAGCSLVFNADNEIYLGGVLASYAFDTRYHFNLTLLSNGDDTGRMFVTITAGDTEVYSGQFTTTLGGNDFGLLRFRGQGYEDPDDNYAQLDNVRINAIYTELPTLAPYEVDDSYVLDLNAGVNAPAATFMIEDGFGILFGIFNDNTYGEDNSKALSFSSSTRPTLVHQLGLPFSLSQLELGEYSTVISSARTITFTGYKHDGTEVTRDFTTDGIVDGIGGANDLELVTFDDTWTNLKAVQFGSLSTVDNIVVSVDVDVDDDEIHDWVDACLPEQAAAAAIENAVARKDGCPLQNRKKSDAGSMGPWALVVLMMARRRRPRG